ncbi:MoxR family ATPase [Oscillatoria amoena NRMC-F 0135]|nr:MoxR family ATPase [Oscillatoria laete-virens]MDL5046563.1 MoxR family ATPase [Oscillatoria amoena NRMC-F 0135]MDL5054820.1 MoxR family ATPase [Oscillatoria laete-virens NRMC-F 0139]
MSFHPSLLVANVEKVVRGKTQCVELAVVCLLARGHLLVEDVPGVGKTTLAYSLAKSIDCDFKRIQFTSDMLPSDILGVSIYDAATREFRFNPGPIFTNIALADEINRTTPKTQSSLLEVMERGKVSIDGQSLETPSPFMVIATQNPVDYEGTFPLPRSQMDRFLMRIEMGYPSPQHELEILKHNQRSYEEIDIAPVASPADILEAQSQVSRIFVSDEIHDYILRIVTATRENGHFEIGVSPRGSLALARAAQAHAYLMNRDFVTPDDVKILAPPVFAHRIILPRNSLSGDSASAESRNRIIDLLQTIPSPP